MPPKLKGIDGLRLRLDALIRSYSSWVDGVAAESFTGRNATTLTARNEQGSAESYRRLAGEIVEDPGFASLTADEQSNVRAIAAATSEIEVELRNLHDPELVWAELEPGEKGRAVANVRIPKAKGEKLARLASLEDPVP